MQSNDGSASTYTGLIKRDTRVPSSTVKQDARNFRQDTAYQAEADPEITGIRLRLKQSGKTRPKGSSVFPQSIGALSDSKQNISRERERGREEKQLLRNKTLKDNRVCHQSDSDNYIVPVSLIEQPSPRNKGHHMSLRASSEV